MQNNNDRYKLPEDVDFPDYTLEWFNTWATRAKENNWTDEQVYYLVDTALVHASVWGDLDMSALGELHKREQFMGLTFEAQKAKSTKKKVTELEIIQNRRKKKANVKVLKSA